jgi:hypothetical protein
MGQASHSLVPSLEKYPTAQSAHVNVSKSEYVPAAQISQVVALTVVLIKPFSHFSHDTTLPVTLMNDPIGHDKDG